MHVIGWKLELKHFSVHLKLHVQQWSVSRVNVCLFLLCVFAFLWERAEWVAAARGLSYAQMQQAHNDSSKLLQAKTDPWKRVVRCIVVQKIPAFVLQFVYHVFDLRLVWSSDVAPAWGGTKAAASLLSYRIFLFHHLPLLPEALIVLIVGVNWQQWYCCFAVNQCPPPAAALFLPLSTAKVTALLGQST